MLLFALRRLLQAVPILLGVSLVVFGLVHIVPGNPIDMLMPPEASPEVIAQMKAAFGFDKPLHIQYLLWLRNAMIGDFGLSVFNASPVLPQLLNALSNTLLLALGGAMLGSSWGSARGLSRPAIMAAGQTNYSPPSPPWGSACRIIGAPWCWC